MNRYSLVKVSNHLDKMEKEVCRSFVHLLEVFYELVCLLPESREEELLHQHQWVPANITLIQV